MATIAQLTAEFDSKGAPELTRDLKNVGNQIDDTGKKSQGFWKNALSIGTGIVGSQIFTSAISGAKNLGMSLVWGASDLSEAQSKVNVVFGESAGVINDWSNAATKSFGLSKTQALDAAGTFGNLFTSMGFTNGAAADMSTGFLGLAADMGSFNNVPTADALAAIQSGLVGEYEPLRRFGVNLSQAAVEQYALTNGLWDGTSAMTEQQKVLARQGIIYEQTTNAQGDFARTSDGLANKSRILSAQLQNIGARIGGFLLPVALKLTSWGVSALDWAGKLGGAFMGMVGRGTDPLTAGLTVLNTALYAAFGGPTSQKIMAFVYQFVDGLQRVVGVAGQVAGFLGGALSSVFGFLAGNMELVIGAAKGIGIVLAGFLAWGAATAIITGIGAALGLLLSPIVLIVAAAALLGIAWQKNLFGVQDKVTALAKHLMVLAKVFGPPLWAGIKRAGSAIAAFLSGIDGVRDAFEDIGGLARSFGAWIGGLFDSLSEKAGVFGETVSRIGDLFETGLRAWSYLIEGLGRLFTGDLSGAMQSFGNLAIAIFQQFTNVALLIPQLLVDSWQAVDWSALASRAGQLLIAGLRGLAGAAPGIFDWISDALQSALTGVSGALGNAIQLAWDQITSINWSDFISNLAWGIFVTALKWGDWILGKIADFGSWLGGLVSDIPWGSLVTGAIEIGSWLADKISDIPWGTLLNGSIEIASWLADKIGEIPWASIINGSIEIATWLADKVGRIPWESIIAGTLEISEWLADKISDIPWKTLVTGSIEIATWLADKISQIPWKDLITGVVEIGSWLADKTSDIPWGTLLTGTIELATWLADKVGRIPWTSIISGTIEIASWLANKVGQIPWKSILKGTIQIATWLADKIGRIPWSSIVKGTIEIATWLADKVGKIPWGSLLTGSLEIATWLAGVVSDIPWGTLITGAINLSEWLADKINDIPWPTISFPSREEILSAIVAAVTPSLGGGDEARPASDDDWNYEDEGKYGPEPGIDEPEGRKRSFSPTLGSGNWQGAITGLNDTSRAMSNLKAIYDQSIPPVNTGFSVGPSTWSVAPVAALNAIRNAFQTTLPPVPQITGANFEAARAVAQAATLGMQTSVVQSTGLMSAGAIKAASTMNTQSTAQANSMKTGVSAALMGTQLAVAVQMALMAGLVKIQMLTMVSNATSSGSALRATLTAAAVGAAAGVSAGLSRIPGIVASVGGQAVGVARSIGANISGAFASGMLSQLGRIQAAAAAMVSAADTALVAKAMISSPSRLFFGRGIQIPAGFVGGIKSGYADVRRAVGDMLTIPLAPSAAIGYSPMGQGGASLAQAPVVQHHRPVHIERVVVDLKGAKELLEFGHFTEDLERSYDIVIGET